MVAPRVSGAKKEEESGGQSPTSTHIHFLTGAYEPIRQPAHWDYAHHH